MKELKNFFFPRKENPSGINTLVVARAIHSIQSGLSNSNNNFSKKVPIELTLRDKRLLHACLLYEATASPAISYGRPDYEFLKFKIMLLDESKRGDLVELAERRWSVILHTKEPAKAVDITSFSGTKSGWEGNGFGTSLIMQTNDVIEQIIKHFGPRFALRSVSATISDASAGQKMLRDKWTTAMAYRLGYAEMRADHFQKTYR